VLPNALWISVHLTPISVRRCEDGPQ